MTALSADTLASALALFSQTPLEITIEEACLRVGIPDSFGPIGRAIELNNRLGQCDFELCPGLEHGELDTPRVLRRKSSPPNLVAEIKDKINIGEGGALEFKSSLVFDHKKFEAALKANINPDPAATDFRSEAVTHSSLKTIAAFLNSQGGELLIGVADDGSLVGLHWDFPAAGANLANGKDKWELHFKNIICARFLDGKTVIDYISVSIVEVDNVLLAYVLVTPRTKLSYLQKSKIEFMCFKRNGNSTDSVDIQDMEEFIDKRRAAIRPALAVK